MNALISSLNLNSNTPPITARPTGLNANANNFVIPNGIIISPLLIALKNPPPGDKNFPSITPILLPTTSSAILSSTLISIESSIFAFCWAKVNGPIVSSSPSKDLSLKASCLVSICSLSCFSLVSTNSSTLAASSLVLASSFKVLSCCTLPKN